MDIEAIKWDPLSIAEVYELFRRFAIPWWISGDGQGIVGVYATRRQMTLLKK